MRKVRVIGVGMHSFGKFLDKGLQDPSRVAIWNAIEDAGVSPKDIEVAHVGNSLAFLVTGQKGVRGQVVLRDAGLGGIPIVDVENACASGTTAFRGLGLEVASDMHEYDWTKLHFAKVVKKNSYNGSLNPPCSAPYPAYGGGGFELPFSG